MSVAAPPPIPRSQAEQAYLDHALASLAAMRQRAEQLLRDLIAAGNPDLDYVAALSRRVRLLADSPRPLLFGRIDEEDGPHLAHRPAPRRGRPGGPGRRRLAGTRRRALLPGQREGRPRPGPPPPDHGRPRRRRRRGRRPLRRAETAMRARPACAAATPCWPSSSGPARARCSTSSPPSRPSRTRSSVPHWTSS